MLVRLAESFQSWIESGKQYIISVYLINLIRSWLVITLLDAGTFDGQNLYVLNWLYMCFNNWKPSWVNYCWWLKSCTTWDVWNPMNNGKNYLSTGAGFQPSTVSYSLLLIPGVISGHGSIPSKSAVAKAMSTGPCMSRSGRESIRSHISGRCTYPMSSRYRCFFVGGVYPPWT